MSTWFQVVELTDREGWSVIRINEDDLPNGIVAGGPYPDYQTAKAEAAKMRSDSGAPDDGEKNAG